ncbi:WXG100 family type VII secretion target [Streptomyces sp. NPDC090108]|uniref:WXG100 family type VII secretion target n=1 Tax=Streptomyces sp. NPDC090108 TaxID=3365947 RepID=UPI00380798F0
MSSLPANWDSATIDVDPKTLHTAYLAVLHAVGDIGDDLNAITDQLNQLLVSWTGDSSSAAKEAQDFNDRWTDVWTRLYGTKDNPEKGVLNRLVAGIETAAVTYSRGERGVSDAWSRWQAALEGMNVDDWGLGPDDDVADALPKHTPPQSPASDYTQAPPEENTVKDEVQVQGDGKGGETHTTAIEQEF